MPPNPVKTQDVYVVIQGYDKIEQQGLPVPGGFIDDNAVATATEYSPKYLRSHPPLKVICYNGGQDDPDTKDTNEDPSDAVLQAISSAMASNPGGRVFLSGGSAGGRNVLKVGAALTARKIPIGFIGIWDGAFDRKDRSNGTIKNPGAKAERMINWYQTFSESLDIENRQEIHGPIEGFHQNIEVGMMLQRIQYGVASQLPFAKTGGPGVLSSVLPARGGVRQVFWKSAHHEAYVIGKDASRWHVRNMLLGS